MAQEQTITIDIEAENKEITRRYRALLRACKRTLEKGDKKIIRKAFDLALEAHQDMRRKSGEPYIYHPIAVAHICAEEIGLGTTSIVCALLHDVVEDTEMTIGDIEKMFGKKEAQIIDGLTKMSGVTEQGSSIQAENFRKMLLTLSDDVRVILIKLADRLHNMRTLGSMPHAKQLKIASETLFMYAPLAHRLGLNAIKTDLEDLGLKYTEPEVYNELEIKVKESEPERKKFITKFITPLKSILETQGFQFKIFGRPKSIFSINKKIHTKGVTFDEIFDLFAIRIVIDSDGEQEKSDCWRVYSSVTDLYYPNPDRLRDWISSPKGNGYESLHTTVMGPGGKWVEVQIRTTRMDEVAEKGYAAHWKYKGDSSESQIDDWINKIRNILESPAEDAMDFLDNFKLNLFTKEIFVFTPKGDVKTLPLKSTVLDFAFDIHTEVGAKCVGGKVNKKLVPMSTELQSGDQVEILTSDTQIVKRDWLDIVVSAQATSKVKNLLKEQFTVIALKGKDILDAKFQDNNLDFTTENVNKLAHYYKVPSKKELCYRIAKGKIDLKDFDFHQEKGEIRHKTGVIKEQKKFKSIKELVAEVGDKSDLLVIGNNAQNLDYTLSPCCNPIAGDDVFGFITEKSGIKIHRVNCPNAVELLASNAYRMIKAKWTEFQALSFLCEIYIKGVDEKGLVNNITNIISSEHDLTMRSIHFDSIDGIFEGKIRMYVNDTNHLTELTKKLNSIKAVQTVKRINNE